MSDNDRTIRMIDAALGGEPFAEELDLSDEDRAALDELIVAIDTALPEHEPEENLA